MPQMPGQQADPNMLKNLMMLKAIKDSQGAGLSPSGPMQGGLGAQQMPPPVSMPMIGNNPNMPPPVPMPTVGQPQNDPVAAALMSQIPGGQ